MAARRKKNPKRKMPPALKAYWAARNKRLRNPKGKRTRKRRRNPVQTQHVLLAQRPGGHVLKYTGAGKFAQTGKGLKYGSKLEAMREGKALRSRFPILKRYKMWAT